MDTSPVLRDSILAELEAILSSPVFQGAERSKTLLKFLVEEAVNDRAERLKEYTIGAEGLGKGDGFDPRADPIVRAEASRLRSRLERYYAVDGRGDSVVVVLPRGSYVPRFESRPPAASSGGPETGAATPARSPAAARSVWLAVALAA